VSLLILNSSGVGITQTPVDIFPSHERALHTNAFSFTYEPSAVGVAYRF